MASSSSITEHRVTIGPYAADAHLTREDASELSDRVKGCVAWTRGRPERGQGRVLFVQGPMSKVDDAYKVAYEIVNRNLKEKKRKEDDIDTSKHGEDGHKHQKDMSTKHGKHVHKKQKECARMPVSPASISIVDIPDEKPSVSAKDRKEKMGNTIVNEVGTVVADQYSDPEWLQDLAMALLRKMHKAEPPPGLGATQEQFQ